MPDVPVWVPIMTAVAGAAVPLAVEWVRSRTTKSAAHEVRTTEADKLFNERRREFDQATLVELQDALLDLGKMVANHYYDRVMGRLESGRWEP